MTEAQMFVLGLAAGAAVGCCLVYRQHARQAQDPELPHLPPKPSWPERQQRIQHNAERLQDLRLRAAA
jgi:hypothetical protein